MAFKVDVIKLNESNLGTKMILKDITKVFEYNKEEQKRTDKQIGLKYHVISPKLKNESFAVTVEQLDPILDIQEVQENEDIVQVTFDNITGKMFQDFKSKEVFLSAKADDVHEV
ncbi:MULTISPECIES: hypothetical protein [unclassified Staphylococcus]|uniref:hypothetical protein n=1 Tax=unclassified Staphylococcus TaxID=91994 RepID=UPI001AEC3E0E|nr:MULTISPECIES: hypothetical protein [unclassified Staphylococcus]